LKWIHHHRIHRYYQLFSYHVSSQLFHKPQFLFHHSPRPARISPLASKWIKIWKLYHL
jgi:hypothetical protein